MQKSAHWLFLVFAFFFLFLASEHTTSAEPIITPVAVSGQPAPGTSARFQSFSDVQVNDSGQVLFIAQLGGAGLSTTNNIGMWIGLPEEMALAVRKGSPAPGYDPGVAFFYLGHPLLAKNGVAAFYARLQGPGISTDAFEPGNDDTLWAAVRPTSAVAALSEPRRLPSSIGPLGTVPRLLVELYRTENGGSIINGCLAAKVLAIATLLAGEKEEGTEFLAWIKENCILKPTPPAQATVQNLPSAAPDPFGFASSTLGQAPSAIAYPGDLAPGTQETFASIDSDSLVTSSQGTLAFVATTSNAKSGIWSGTATNLQPIAFSGAPLPSSLKLVFGTNAQWDNAFDSSVNLCLNAKGEVAFTPLLGSTTYLLAGPPEAPRVVASFVPSNSTNEGFFYAQKMVMSAAGDVAFIGGHTSLREIPGIGGVPGQGLQALGLTHQHGPPLVMLSEGRTAPGLRDGEVISFLGVEGGPFMNRQGQVAFHAEIGTSYGPEHTTDNGIWLIDPVRGVQLVARGGTQIDLGGGRIATLDTRSVYFLTSHDNFYSGGEDGRPKPFNDLSQVVFVGSWTEANGTSGTGVLVAGEVRVVSGVKAGDDMQISFATAASRKYRVEFRNTVEGGVWTTLNDGVAGTGGPVIVKDIGAAKLTKRFYRVASLP